MRAKSDLPGAIEAGSFHQGILQSRSIQTVTAAATSAIFNGSPFERRFRDMHTVTAQGQAHMANFESAGQALFGMEPNERL